jgi:hypothetical protein
LNIFHSVKKEVRTHTIILIVLLVLALLTLLFEGNGTGVDSWTYAAVLATAFVLIAAIALSRTGPAEQRKDYALLLYAFVAGAILEFVISFAGFDIGAMSVVVPFAALAVAWRIMKRRDALPGAESKVIGAIIALYLISRMNVSIGGPPDVLWTFSQVLADILQIAAFVVALQALAGKWQTAENYLLLGIAVLCGSSLFTITTDVFGYAFLAYSAYLFFMQSGLRTILVRFSTKGRRSA